MKTRLQTENETSKEKEITERKQDYRQKTKLQKENEIIRKQDFRNKTK